MGYFRKYKKSDYTSDECRDHCERLVGWMAATDKKKDIEKWAQEWAEFRELLARHEGNNYESG